MKQHIIDIIKHNFGILVIGSLFLLFWFNGCGKGGDTPSPKSDTVTHTQQVLQPIVVNPPYTPQQSGPTVVPINIPSQYTASADIAKLTEQYNELVKQFLSIKNYRDSITLKDTAGNRVGVVNLDQTVAENTLKSTQSSYQLYFPHTTTTITNTIFPKKKNQLFFGANFTSTTTTPRFTASIDLLLKNKSDNIFSLGGGYDIYSKQPLVKVGYYQKLSFRKK